MADELSRFWEEADGSGDVEGLPPPAIALCEASRATLDIDLKVAQTFLEKARASELSPPWSHVARLLSLRIQVRSVQGNFDESRAELLRLVDEIPDEEVATRGRCLHLLGVIELRCGRLLPALDALRRALEQLETPRSRVWLLDTVGQVLLGLGAWTLARNIIERVAKLKLAEEDWLGVAISTGHLARLSLQLDAPREAREWAQGAIADVGEHLPAVSLLRLHTCVVESLLSEGGTELAREGTILESLYERAEKHPLRGYAAIALARQHQNTPTASRKWLDAAAADMPIPAGRAIVSYWRFKLGLDAQSPAAWQEQMQEAFEGLEFVCEAEIRTLLLVAAAEQSADKARAILDRAEQRATDANNPLWNQWVESAAREIDPTGGERRAVRRLTGCELEDLQRTERREATVIFADLVGFTPRSQSLEPEEVMRVVRSVFELSASSLARFKVRPLAYLGDGLLAIAEGEAHQERGLEFALEFVRVSKSVSVFLQTMRLLEGAEVTVQDRLDSRAGVASGPVVCGALGALVRQEYTVIGHTVNLAARLQGQAEPNEVVCDAGNEYLSSTEFSSEQVELKGLTNPVPIRRYRS